MPIAPELSTNPSPKNGSAEPGVIPPSIPTEHTYRTLVVCFDGTGDQYAAPTPTPLLPNFYHVLTVLLSSQVRHGRKDIKSIISRIES